MRYLSLLISLLFITCAASAQEVRLKSVTMTTDPMPHYMQRTDLNGEICGLVKVIIPGNQVRFEGSLIGEPEFKNFRILVLAFAGAPRFSEGKGAGVSLP